MNGRIGINQCIFTVMATTACMEKLDAFLFKPLLRVQVNHFLPLSSDITCVRLIESIHTEAALIFLSYC